MHPEYPPERCSEETDMKEVKICKYEDAFRVPVAFDGRKMYTSDKVEIVHVLLKPGEFIEKHPNPVDVVFYILSGKGTLTVEDAVYESEENSTIFVPALVMREWRNTGEKDLRILVIKS
jgi:mannose-6-phosphate isomerase-like protein (cupin superfamily)